jgi:alpha-glucoside transport system permease protein
LLGAWLAPDLDGSKAEVFIVAVVLGLLVGGIVGSIPHPDAVRRGEISVASRKYIFLAPALFFVLAALVIPLGRTIWLGFLTGNPNDLRWTGVTNYSDILTDPGIIDFSGFPDMFSSRLFWAAVILLILGIAVGTWIGRSGGSGLGTGFSLTAGSLSLMAGGTALLGFAIFISIRGTIPNNLWWIFSVIIFAVSLGLAVAVLADRSKGENIAKSLIFLPMAISFVGASVIWRLIYVARPPQDPQTGVFNSLWIMVGEWSNSTIASTLVAIVLGAIAVGLLYLAWRGWQAGSNSIVAGSLITTAFLGWLIYRFVGPGIGGFKVSEVTGEIIADPVLFIQNAPWNNFWMMVVFIWIQTGFAMVIFSAAIKAVPTELLEAARIDGATESQSFWRVTVPQIFPTIGVVVTTLIVTVLKVFDIPKVMTNGNFDTQVLANEMWERAFTQLNFGLGSAVAVLLFIGVLPVMYINIRRMQRERLG